ncbi:DUF4124 domain-containing protein [Xylophilus sp. ASV27]|uniref:DUF4124 domain-containing protein n=1 Tax=Xylophilus sp. ASV27 TaxID=2795129 RepID=UPI0018EA9E4A|nr:DUF4124 domain-containing protein [Xylophilus sp. ASV27]
MSIPWRIAVLALASLASSPAGAVYKCVGTDGKVAYQDAACPKGAKSTGVELPASRPPPIVPGSTPGQSEADRLNALSAASERERRARELAQRIVPNAEAALAAQRAQCAQAQASADPARETYLATMAEAAEKSGTAVPPGLFTTIAERCDARESELLDALDYARRECAVYQCWRE